MAYGRPTTSSSSGYGRTTLAPTSYGRPTGPATTKKKGPGGFLGALQSITGKPGDIMTPLHVMASPIGWALGHHAKDKKLRAAGHVLSAAGASPVDVAAHPSSSAKNLASMVVGLAETPTAMKKAIGKYGFAKTMAMMYHSTVADYKTRYGANWEAEARKHPLFNLADAFMVLGPALKGAAVANAVKDLGKVGEAAPALAKAERGALIKAGRSTDWAKMSPAEKLRVARAEAKTPGQFTLGKAKTRDLTLQIAKGDAVYPEGQAISSTQALSHSPLRRGVQESMDALAAQFPDLPAVGARSRITRANAAQLPRSMDRALGQIVGLDALKKLNRVEKTRLWAQVQLVKHEIDPVTKEISHDHGAVTSKIKDLRNALASEFENRNPAAMDEPSLQDWLLGAKQQGFGQPLLKRLDEAAAYTPKKGSNYERAIQPLIEATNVSENVIGDTNGFARLSQDQKRLFDRLKAMSDENGHVLPEHADSAHVVADQLREVTAMLSAKGPRLAEMMDKRRNLLSDWVKVNTPVDAPERGQWAAAMADLGWEGPQIRDALRASDMMARSARPHNPASFYAEKVGSPAGLTPQQLSVRAQALWQDFPQHGETPLIEGDAMHPAESSAYYSRAQKQVADAWGDKPYRQAGQVRAQLQKNISADEWRNAQLDNFFDQHGLNDMISQEQFQSFLATPLNMHNIHEIHRVGSNAADLEGMATIYDDPFEYGDTLLSRAPQEGEYHEIVFRLPKPPSEQAAYRGAGARHWQEENVVAHIRFHHFEEDGKQKLVVEEIQSDWASDARRGDTALTPPLTAVRAHALAVDRVLRYAGENGVDEVIFPEAHVQHVRNHAGGFLDDNEAAATWEGAIHDVPVDEARRGADEILSRGGGATSFERLYEEAYPKLAEKRLGIKGDYSTEAYHGHFSGPTGARSEPGPIRGTVFKLDEGLREKARQPSPLYQRQPEWNNVARGANELLIGKGDRLIHLFKNADVSTWLHELAHSAVYDLPEADAKILHDYYGGGKPVTSWDVASHENYARDFERFVRTADLSFLPRPVAEVFGRIQGWMRRVLGEVKNANPEAEIPQQVEDVFGRMLWRGGDDTPDVFMPHRAGAPELTGARTSRGVPRAKRDVGDYTPSRIPIFAKNNLGLLRSGLIHDDPNLLIEHVNRLISLQKANQLREFLLDKASPLMPGDTPNLETQYVVKRYGSSVDKPLYDALESAHNPSEIRSEIAKYIDSNLSDDPKVVEGWKGEGQLYVIDKKTVDMLFKYVTGKTPGATTKPITPGGQVIDAVLNSMRGLLLYANPGFYVANMVGNLGMQMFNDPRSLKYLPSAMKNGAALARGAKVDPLFERITVEMGRGPTSGGLSPERRGILGPDLGVSGSNVVGRGAERVSQGMHRIGSNAGAVVDEPFRVAAWRQEASKMGYSTDAQVKALLDQAVKDTRKRGYMKGGTKALDDLNSIRDKAEQLMLDFDSMTPFERTWLSRIIFLYPFLKASAKYPAMFAGEHPTTFGAAAQTSNVGQQFANQVLGPRPDLPLWAQGYARIPGGMANVGSIDQMSVLAGLIESATHVGHKTPVGINSPWEYLAPIMQVAAEAARGQNRYGREAGVGEIVKTDFAVPAWISALYREPSQLYTNRGEYGALLRSLRLAPFGVNPNYGSKASGKGWGGSGSSKGWGK